MHRLEKDSQSLLPQCYPVSNSCFIQPPLALNVREKLPLEGNMSVSDEELVGLLVEPIVEQVLVLARLVLPLVQVELEVVRDQHQN